MVSWLKSKAAEAVASGHENKTKGNWGIEVRKEREDWGGKGGDTQVEGEGRWTQVEWGPVGGRDGDVEEPQVDGEKPEEGLELTFAQAQKANH